MRTNIYLFSAVLIGLLSFASCKPKGENKTAPITKTETEVPTKITKYSFINPFNNYFAVTKVKSNTELSLDSVQFSKEFQFAATMNNTPMSINFQKERVGAIVLPETAYDTKIVLDTNFVRNDTLHVVYTINKGKDKNTFTTIPVQLFTYSSKFHLMFDKK